MRFVQIETLPAGMALVDVDRVTHAVPQEEGTRLFLGAQTLDVPHTLAELENVLAGRERGGMTARRAGRGSTCAERRRRSLAA